jgi:hypothetical protein
LIWLGFFLLFVAKQGKIEKTGFSRANLAGLRTVWEQGQNSG